MDGINKHKNMAFLTLARDHILPGFMAAAAKHDCDLIWSEAGELNGICHNKRFIMPIAYREEFDSFTGRLKEDKRDLVSGRLADFKYIINSNMKTYLLPETMVHPHVNVKNVEENKPSIMDITRGVCGG